MSLASSLAPRPGAHDVALALAFQPAQADDLAATQLTAQRWRAARGVRLRTSSAIAPARVPPRREQRLQRTADHQGDQLSAFSAPIGSVATQRPSFSTVTVSHRRKISSRRWLM